MKTGVIEWRHCPKQTELFPVCSVQSSSLVYLSWGCWSRKSGYDPSGQANTRRFLPGPRLPTVRRRR